MPVRLVQVSDCHLGPERHTPYRGKPALPALERVIASVRRWAPDAVLATGDLSENGEPASYGLLGEALALIDAPVLALPGNHDDPKSLSEVLPTGPWDGPLREDIAGWQIVLLDSTIPGQPCGRLGDDSLAAVREAASGAGPPVLVALHHQPMAVGSPWIDRYPLEQPGDFRQAVTSGDRIRVVTWGHVHHGWRREGEGRLWCGAPSTATNSLSGRERFTPDPAGPACRWFILGDDGSVASGLLRPLR